MSRVPIGLAKSRRTAFKKQEKASSIFLSVSPTLRKKGGRENIIFTSRSIHRATSHWPPDVS